MTSQDVIVIGTGVGRFGGERSYLDAVRAVEREANGEGIETQAAEYADVLESALEAAVALDHTDLDAELDRLRTFFTRLTGNVLSRAIELTHERQDTLWAGSTPKSHS